MEWAACAPHQTEWAHYLRERVRQKFTAVQWVATQWLASLQKATSTIGKAFKGIEHITLLIRNSSNAWTTYVEATCPSRITQRSSDVMGCRVALGGESNPGYLPAGRSSYLG